MRKIQQEQGRVRHHSCYDVPEIPTQAAVLEP